MIQSFQDLQLPEPVGQALKAMAFEKPTPIQAEAIPAVLTRRDLIGCAQTGTGKTAAFCLPILLRLLESPRRIALILVPTRELASQIQQVWGELIRFMHEPRCTCLIGGVSMRPQFEALRRNPRLVVATPGRLLDHLKRGSLNLSQTEILVLDEADRMLDMGFAPQLNQVLRFLPRERQTLMFSATMPPEIELLAGKYLKNPQRITIGSIGRTVPQVSQAAIHTTQQMKNETLLEEINRRCGSILVFARTKSRTDRVTKYLTSYGLDVNRIHGGRSQSQRVQALDGFKKGKVRILVATDIAARGIDVDDIAHVINYDLPMVPEDYIHRIGRTARAGASGQAASLLTPDDRSLWRDITKLLERSGSAIPQILGKFPAPVRAL